MRTLKLSEVKDRLSELVSAVRRGSRIRILVHGKPAADLVPIERDDDQPGVTDAELAALERAGVLRRASARRSPGADPLDRPGPRVAGGDAVDALVLERARR